MRTIQLTHDELDLLLNSLLIASSVYQEQFKELCIKFPNEREKGQYWYDKSILIYDLSHSILEGEKDV